MCEHLQALDNAIKARGITETFRGKAWSNNCREWVYYDCVLNMQEVRARYELPGFIKAHVNDDFKSGPERGFVCTLCQDAVMGVHPRLSEGKIVFE